MNDTNLDLISLENEEWRDVVGYEGLYKVSNLGRVYSCPRWKAHGGIMNGHPNRKGYIIVTLRKDGRQISEPVHRLVALAFIPTDDTSLSINHKDEVKTNNAVSNLEWMTLADNTNYGTRNARASIRQGKPIRCVETGEEYLGAKWAAIDKHLDPSGITKALKNPNRTSGGYHWTYIESN